MRRFATANWRGNGMEGTGHLVLQSALLNNAQFTYKSRFEAGVGTNPEELIAGAHASCFTMKLSFVLGEAGYVPDSIDTRCEVTIDNGVITNSHLTISAKVPGISAQKLEACILNAKENCPVSKVLNCKISHEVAVGSPK